MKHTTNRKYWFIWLLITVVLLSLLGFKMLRGKDKRLFMPGELTGGHHQIGIACQACHSKEFTSKDDFQKTCIKCHGDMRKKPFDSHPQAKFKDPRNAEFLEKIDVLHCVSCHTEHRPEMVHKGGYTQPKDFCIHCHSDIAKERPSHEGMDFMTCNNAGCHNFHNNRALYTDFLAKHLHEPENLKKAVLPQKDYAHRLDEIATYPHDRYPVKTLLEEDADAPPEHNTEKKIMTDWLATAHARSGVNCTACHLVEKTGSTQRIWTDHPNKESCSQCHDIELKHFQQGKHGMRLKVGLSPMTPSLARLPMKSESKHKPLDCISCHASHRFDTKHAAVEACLECHDDEHSRAYKASPHFKLWQKEVAGKLPPGSGVSCASCHMPRMDMDVNDWMSRIVVMHNQNATLVPNEKMLRPACLHCHGLEFSINALADDELVKRNFRGSPMFHTDSLKLVEDDIKRHEEKQRKDK